MESCARKSAQCDLASSFSGVFDYLLRLPPLRRRAATPAILSRLCGMKAMRFSWTSLILAPLLVPVIFSATMIFFVRGDPLMAFLIMLVLGCILSYATTIFLFLPCLFLLSLEQQMTGFKVCLLGLVIVVFVSLTLIAWGSSGPDSGPPIENFFV